MGIIALIIAFCVGLLTENKVSQTKEDSKLKAIKGNLRQFASAGEQYLMEHGGDEVSYQRLLKKEYFRDLHSVRGEDYSSLVFRKNERVLYVQLPNTAYYVLLHH